MENLTEIELKKIATALTETEYNLLCEWGLKGISGGFVQLDVVEYKEDVVLLTLKAGVQSDCSNEISEEEVTLDRKTLKLI